MCSYHLQSNEGSVEGVTKTLQISDAFVGVILLPIVAWTHGLQRMERGMPRDA